MLPISQNQQILKKTAHLMMKVSYLAYNVYSIAKMIQISIFLRKIPLISDSKKKKREGSFWMAEKRFRYWVRHIVKTQIFYWSVIVLVFFNSVTVAAEHYDQPQYLTDFLCTYFFLSQNFGVHSFLHCMHAWQKFAQ